MVYGGDESVGDGVDCLVNVWVCPQENFGGVGQNWGKFLVILLESGQQSKGQGVLVGYDDTGEVSGGGFSESGESLLQGDEAGGVIDVLVW